jgi:octaprenyl-diphosphate synthase
MNTTLTTASNGTFRPAPALLAAVAPDLAAVETVLDQALASPHAHVARLMEYLRHFRGKRLRPALLLLTAQACGRVTPTHHLLGAVVEMIHTATLVHDDVLDDADTRRHVATVNTSWGNRQAILLGDMLFSQAFHLAAQTGDARACSIIGSATNRVCEGELRQVSESGNLDLSEEAYLDIIDGKTAELTACCCRLGAMYAGSGPEEIEQATIYGRALGMAFQIADDLLDLTGREAATGKTLGTDLQQQKLTLPLIYLLSRVSAEQAATVKQVLRNPDTDRRAYLMPLLDETHALADAQAKARAYAESARAALTILPASEARATLTALAGWSLGRSH